MRARMFSVGGIMHHFLKPPLKLVLAKPLNEKGTVCFLRFQFESTHSFTESN